MTVLRFNKYNINIVITKNRFKQKTIRIVARSIKHDAHVAKLRRPMQPRKKGKRDVETYDRGPYN